MTTTQIFTHSPRNKKNFTHASQKPALFLSQYHSRRLGRIIRLWILPRFGDARTSDDDHLALSTFSIDEELIIRNRGRHVEVRGQTLPRRTISFTSALVSQEVADASLEIGTRRHTKDVVRTGYSDTPVLKRQL